MKQKLVSYLKTHPYKAVLIVLVLIVLMYIFYIGYLVVLSDFHLQHVSEALAPGLWPYGRLCDLPQLFTYWSEEGSNFSGSERTAFFVRGCIAKVPGLRNAVEEIRYIF